MSSPGRSRWQRRLEQLQPSVGSWLPAALGLLSAWLVFWRPLPGKPVLGLSSSLADGALGLAAILAALAVSALLFVVAYPNDAFFASLVLSERHGTGEQTTRHPVYVDNSQGRLVPMIRDDEPDSAAGAWRFAKASDFSVRPQATALDDLTEVFAYTLWAAIALAASSLFLLVVGGEPIGAPESISHRLALVLGTITFAFACIQFGNCVAALRSFGRHRASFLRSQVLDSLD